MIWRGWFFAQLLYINKSINLFHPQWWNKWVPRDRWHIVHINMRSMRHNLSIYVGFAQWKIKPSHYLLSANLSTLEPLDDRPIIFTWLLMEALLLAMFFILMGNFGGRYNTWALSQLIQRGQNIHALSCIKFALKRVSQVFKFFSDICKAVVETLNHKASFCGDWPVSFLVFDISCFASYFNYISFDFIPG